MDNPVDSAGDVTTKQHILRYHSNVQNVFIDFSILNGCIKGRHRVVNPYCKLVGAGGLPGCC